MHFYKFGLTREGLQPGAITPKLNLDNIVWSTATNMVQYHLNFDITKYILHPPSCAKSLPWLKGNQIITGYTCIYYSNTEFRYITYILVKGDMSLTHKSHSTLYTKCFAEVSFIYLHYSQSTIRCIPSLYPSIYKGLCVSAREVSFYTTEQNKQGSKMSLYT